MDYFAFSDARSPHPVLLFISEADFGILMFLGLIFLFWYWLLNGVFASWWRWWRFVIAPSSTGLIPPFLHVGKISQREAISHVTRLFSEVEAQCYAAKRYDIVQTGIRLMRGKISAE